MVWRIRILTLIGVLHVGGIYAADSDIIGRAGVIVGDTLEIRGQRIRLFGIDTPESAQLCYIEGQPYRYLQNAALALANKIGRRTVHYEQ